MIPWPRVRPWRAPALIITLLTALTMQGARADAAAADAPVATGAAPATSPALVPFATQFDVRSKTTGRTYRIYVARPRGQPPAGGWPVVYVLDGDIAFATVASQNFLQDAFGERAAIIVGIGYPDAAASLVLRTRDLTISPPTAEGRRIGLLGDGPAAGWGGAALFHRFMMEELKPLIRTIAPIDETAQALMGYSYGGLFALNVLFTDPGAYRTFVIGSPSIWWNGGEVLSQEAAFAAAVRAGRAAPRVLVTSNGLEQDPGMAPLPTDPTQRALVIDAVRAERMVDNARDLAGRLGALGGGAGYRVDYVVFPGETHMSGLPAALSRGYHFVVGR